MRKGKFHMYIPGVELVLQDQQEVSVNVTSCDLTLFPLHPFFLFSCLMFTKVPPLSLIFPKVLLNGAGTEYAESLRVTPAQD